MPDFFATTLSFKYILEVIAAEANSGRIWSKTRAEQIQIKGRGLGGQIATVQPGCLGKSREKVQGERQARLPRILHGWETFFSVLWKSQKLKCNVLQAWKLTAENTRKGDHVSYLLSALTNFSYTMREKSEIGLPPHLLIAPDPKARLQAPSPFVSKQIRKKVPMTYRMVSSRER